MMEDALRLVFFAMEERFEEEDEVCLLLTVIIVGLVGLTFDQFVSSLAEPINHVIGRPRNGGSSFEQPRNTRNSD